MLSYNVTAETTDDDIRQAAARICYQIGIAMNPIVESLFATQRSLARLEAEVQSLRKQGHAPHLRNVEAR